MLQVARLSPQLLGESTDLVAAFFRQQGCPDGGFGDRAGQSDLYYTVFGLEGLIAVHQDPLSPSVRRYLASFGSGEGLDFVHLCCLVRAWATVTRSEPAVDLEVLLARIESHRAADGGYSTVSGAHTGTAYAAFLALGAYQDARVPLPRPDRLIASMGSLRADDGAFGNQPQMPQGQTSATAAAVAVQRQLGEVDPSVVPWLLARLHPEGGFTAAPSVPMPDLLSTATALHALASLQHPLSQVREACLDFIDTLWTNRGGFYGHWADDHVDCEYTYYGLLALGHLAP